MANFFKPSFFQFTDTILHYPSWWKQAINPEYDDMHYICPIKREGKKLNSNIFDYHSRFSWELVTLDDVIEMEHQNMLPKERRDQFSLIALENSRSEKVLSWLRMFWYVLYLKKQLKEKKEDCGSTSVKKKLHSKLAIYKIHNIHLSDDRYVLKQIPTISDDEEIIEHLVSTVHPETISQIWEERRTFYGSWHIDTIFHPDALREKWLNFLENLKDHPVLGKIYINLYKTNLDKRTVPEKTFLSAWISLAAVNNQLRSMIGSKMIPCPEIDKNSLSFLIKWLNMNYRVSFENWHNYWMRYYWEREVNV